MTSKESPTPSDGCSSCTMRILRCVGMHPTRGIVHATALLKMHERAKHRAADLRDDLYAQGCVRVSPVLAHRVEEYPTAHIAISREKARLRDLMRRFG